MPVEAEDSGASAGILLLRRGLLRKQLHEFAERLRLNVVTY
jgi:hypothetical protein